MVSVLTVAGVMSGTSLDAIDVAITRISADVTGGALGAVDVKLLHFASVPWADSDRAALLDLIHHPDAVSLRVFGRLNNMVGVRIAEAVMHAAKEAGLPIEAIDLVASHGT